MANNQEVDALAAVYELILRKRKKKTASASSVKEVALAETPVSSLGNSVKEADLRIPKLKRNRQTELNQPGIESKGNT